MPAHRLHAAGDGPDVEVVHVLDTLDLEHRLAHGGDVNVGRGGLEQHPHRLPQQVPGREDHQAADQE